MPRVWKFGDHINTDDILPGKYAPFMVGEDRFHTFAFAHLRPEFAKEVRPGDILVFGRNAGLGSSREYAPEALRKLGIRAVIAKSYARIFFLETGVLPRGGERFALRPPPSFLLEALREGSLLDYYKKYGHFPGE